MSVSVGKYDYCSKCVRHSMCMNNVSTRACLHDAIRGFIDHTYNYGPFCALSAQFTISAQVGTLIFSS